MSIASELNVEVRWGDQTWEEMMIGWFTYTVPYQPAPVEKAQSLPASE